MNTHFVCRGLCGSESSTPGICPTGDCVKNGKPLIECKCSDGQHQEIGSSLSIDTEPEESLEEQLDSKVVIQEEETGTDGPLNFDN